MDITPIYDLRARLRLAMIAGTSLLSEDFRLKRAVEAFEPLEGTSPTLARIGQLVRMLVDPAQADKEGALLETITLVDAVLCTQGIVAADTGRQGAEQEIKELSGSAWGSAVTKAPYSLLKAFADTGEEQFSYITKTHTAHREFFYDYRVRAAMVKALGAREELAEQVEEWLREDASLLFLLQNQFVSGRNKEKVRRVRVMDTIAPREANPFFVEQLAGAKGELRQALILALRHCPENEELLWQLVRSEKGACKQRAYQALACMEGDGLEAFYAGLCQENPKETMEYLSGVNKPWAARLVAAKLEEQLKLFEGKEEPSMTGDQYDLMAAIGQAAAGKTGPEIMGALRKAIRLGNVLEPKVESLRFNVPVCDLDGSFTYVAATYQGMLAYMIQLTMIRTQDPEMCRLALEMYRLALEMYEEKRQIREGDGLYILDASLYFQNAAIAHLIMDEDCSGWLSEQLEQLFSAECAPGPGAIFQWAWRCIFWSESRQEFVLRDTDFGRMEGFRTHYIQTLKQDITGRITDIFMQCRDECLDHLLGKFAKGGNKAYRDRLTDYLYQRALEVRDNRPYLSILRDIGCKRCEGLAVHYFKVEAESSGSGISVWDIIYYAEDYLPGDDQVKSRELQRVYDLIQNGEFRLRKFPDNNIKDLLSYLSKLQMT